MNRRTSVAGVDELKHAFEQTSISLQDGSLFNNKSNGIRQIGICDSDDSDDVLIQELSDKINPTQKPWFVYLSKRKPSQSAIEFINFRLVFSYEIIGIGSIYIDNDLLFWKSYGSEEYSQCLCWEVSRVKDIHFHIQPQETPFCSISFFSNQPITDHFDTFLFNQDCTDSIDTSLACQELSNLRHALSSAYASVKNNQRHYLQHLIRSYVLSSSHPTSSYINHIHQTVQSLTQYPLPNPTTLTPSSSTPLTVDKKEQQRILIPYRQALMKTLSIQEELKNRRYQALGIVVTRSNQPDRMGMWEYSDMKTKMTIPYDVYLRRWQEVRDARSTTVPFEVDVESELTTHFAQPNGDEAHTQSGTSTAVSPRIRSRIHDESKEKAHGIPRETTSSGPRIPQKALLEMFEVYSNEMEMRKQQYKRDVESLTQNYHNDLNQITLQFISVLESQGVDSATLEQLMSSIR